MDGGSIDILNQVVVGASGGYKSYVGWIYDETIVSYNPVFTADIKLLDPSAGTETGEGIEEGNSVNTAEVTIDELNGKIASTAAPPGFNVAGTSVFNNLRYQQRATLFHSSWRR